MGLSSGQFSAVSGDMLVVTRWGRGCIIGIQSVKVGDVAAVPTIHVMVIHAIKYQLVYKVSSAGGERPWLARWPPTGMG